MIVPVVVLCATLVMLVFEVRRPGRSWPKVGGWWGRALLLNSFQALSVFLAGTVWDGWLLGQRLWSADALGPIFGALLGYVVQAFIYYWWHRWRHEVPFLWRFVHQVHHSPQRIELITSFYKHPIEILLNSLISSAVLYFVVGLNAQAATGALLLAGLAELFYHWNIATPHWLGYVIQRPESHCVHHQEDLHAFNYGDLPIFDMMFGTFRNPKAWNARCGLGAENEPRLAEMLAGIDVTASPPVSTAR